MDVFELCEQMSISALYACLFTQRYSKKKLPLSVKYFSLSQKQKAILLVLLFEEISIRPELSSPPGFRIQGGSLRCLLHGFVPDINCRVVNMHCIFSSVLCTYFNQFRFYVIRTKTRPALVLTKREGM